MLHDGDVRAYQDGRGVEALPQRKDSNSNLSPRDVSDGLIVLTGVADGAPPRATGFEAVSRLKHCC